MSIDGYPGLTTINVNNMKQNGTNSTNLRTCVPIYFGHSELEFLSAVSVVDEALSVGVVVPAVVRHSAPAGGDQNRNGGRVLGSLKQLTREFNPKASLSI